MNEMDVRDRLRRAIGESDLPPGMQASIEARLMQATPREYPRGLALLAAVLAVALVAVLVTPVLIARYAAWRRSHLPSPAVVATPTPSPTAVAAVDCKLPVVVARGSGPAAFGFVNTKTGTFNTDAAASIDGLPGGGSPGSGIKGAQAPGPVQYNPTFKRWMPVGGPYVAPDGRSYVWENLLPKGSTTDTFTASELHLYNLATARDGVLWGYAGSIDVYRWDASGILVMTVPPRGGGPAFWLIDPLSGAVTSAPMTADPRRLTILPGDASSTGVIEYGSIGQDAQGHPLFRIGSRAGGDREWIFFESAPGIRVTVYRGTQGDATAFDPYGALGDTTGIWFGDYERAAVWHWDASAGLRKVAIEGLPTLLGDPNSQETLRPAGPCF